jgi:hypothetical protein
MKNLKARESRKSTGRKGPKNGEVEESVVPPDS